MISLESDILVYNIHMSNKETANTGVYLYIIGDKNFKLTEFLEDNNYEFWYDKRPKRILKGERVYIYVSGGTKAIKYEFVVSEVNDDPDFRHMDLYKWEKYLINYEYKPGDWKDYNKRPAVKLKLIREIKDLDASSLKNMKEKGKILGMLFSNRELRPFSVQWIDSIK